MTKERKLETEKQTKMHAYPKLMLESRSIEWMKQAFPASFSEKSLEGM